MSAPANHSLPSLALPQNLTQEMSEAGVIAVLVIKDLDHAVPVAKALLRGGIRLIELTLRTPVALEAIRAINRQVPEIRIGAGTVLTPEQVEKAQAAGAVFAVAPGMNPNVLEAANSCGLPFAPGIATASELEHALELGCRQVKFFPAEPQGGLPYLKSLAAAYRHTGVSFIPLGGLSPSNAAAYLSETSVLAIGGSWIANAELIQAQDWQSIETRAQAARELVRQTRGNAPDER